MYPTRTTSTTGTFEIPPHPTPRPTAPAEAERPEAERAAETHPEAASTGATPTGATQAGATPAGAAPAGAAPRWVVPAEPDRAAYAPAAALSDAVGRVPAEGGAERSSPLPSERDRAAYAPAVALSESAGRVPARGGAEWVSGLPAEHDRPAAAVPVAAGWVAAEAPDAVASVPAAAVSEWAAPTGWALAAEPSGPARAEAAHRPAPTGADRDTDGPVAVRAAAQAMAVAPHGPAARVGEGARSDVPAARAQTAPGVDIPHPQDEAAHAGAATLRLRTPDAEAARPHPQDEAWPPAAALRPGPYAGADHAPRHAGAPAAWDLPGQGGSSAQEGSAPQHAAPGPAAPEAESADPHPVRDPAEPGDADQAAPADGWEVTWSVPAPAVPADGAPGRAEAEADAEADADAAVDRPIGEADSGGEAATAPQSATGGGVVPGPAAAEVVEVVARAVARIAEDDTQDLPVVPPVRGVAVTEVPVHLPFRGAAQPRQPNPNPTPKSPKAQAATPRSAPGRRVPRGDDRLHEHHGPVLPGWIAVAVGGIALAGCAVVLWRAGAVPDSLAAAFGAESRPYRGLQARFWPPLAFLGIVTLLALGGLGRGRAGHAWVLTLFGRYRGTVRRSGLTWISPLLLRRRVDVRLRHWRSDPMPAVDSGGLALQVVVQVVWQVKDTARATLAVADHVDYLAEQVESAMARVLSQLPADAFHDAAPTLRDAEAVGDALTRMLAAETEAVGVEVFSAQPTRIEYAPEVADAMRRRRVAAIDAKHRDTVLTSVVDAVDDTVHRLTSRGLVELDDYERKALVKDLTVAFYTGRAE